MLIENLDKQRRPVRNERFAFHVICLIWARLRPRGQRATTGSDGASPYREPCPRQTFPSCASLQIPALRGPW